MTGPAGIKALVRLRRSASTDTPDMSNQSSAIRSSHSSRRYSPYSRSPTSSPPPSDQHPSGHRAARNLQERQLSPPSAYYPSLQSPANSVTGHPPVPPLTGFPPVSLQRPSTSAHQLQHAACQEPLHPFPLCPHSSQLSANNSYLDSAIYSLPGSRPLHAAQLPVVNHQPDDLIFGDDSMEQQPLHFPQGRKSSFETPRDSFYSGYPTRGISAGSPTFPTFMLHASTSQHPLLLDNDTGRLDSSTQYAESQIASASTSRNQSTSNVSVHSPPNTISAHPSPSPQRFTPHSEAIAYRNYSSTRLVPPLQPRLPQEQALTLRRQSHLHYPSQGAFGNAQNFVVKDSVFIDNNAPVDNFMEKLLQHTIIGAEFDSSARDPPPRCYPGTRLAILQRCLNFIVSCQGKEKLRWVVGPAGVGKSAVMQIVTEKAPDGVIFASVFLSVNGRRDGSKTVVTIAYQLAVKCVPYRQFIRDEIGLDPSLLQKSLAVQFNKFIVEPFIRRHLFDHPRRFLIVIDGLDECDNPLTQQNILELIFEFCVAYPTSPIAWIVASRPEPHITSFFEQVEVQSVFIKEEMRIDSDEACEDVQRYLRAELNKIKLAYPSLRRKREWPSEHEFTTIASAAGGLFAYAATVIRFMGVPHYRDPIIRLRHVLETISTSPQDDKSGRDHPMAQLDALYARILSDIPDDVMINTRKLLLLQSISLYDPIQFRKQCNLLGFTEDAAYGATYHLHAVAKIPEPEQADHDFFEYFHKSFQDFLFDFQRSGFSENVVYEAKELSAQLFLRVVEQVPHGGGLASGGGISVGAFGKLKDVPGLCDNVFLSWPSDDTFQQTDDELRRSLYYLSMLEIGFQFAQGGVPHGSMSYFHALTTRFTTLGRFFPAVRLLASVFGQSRPELSKLGKLKQVPLRTFDYAAICGCIEIRFTSPIGINIKPFDPWSPPCYHGRTELDDLQQWRGWSTQLGKFGIVSTDIPGSNNVALQECHQEPFTIRRGHLSRLPECDYCLQRFSRHFIDNPDNLVTVFIDSTGLCYLEFSFVDPDDGVSEWTYRFCHSGRPTSINV